MKYLDFYYECSTKSIKIFNFHSIEENVRNEIINYIYMVGANFVIDQEFKDIVSNQFREQIFIAAHLNIFLQEETDLTAFLIKYS